MANRADRAAALMSIHPRYAEKILDGSKQVEFRRSGFATVPSVIVVYATAPVSKVIGLFEVDGVDEASPSELWERYRLVGGISENGYKNYYRGAKRGIAIRVGRVHSLKEPLELSEFIGNGQPPQSFRYLGSALIARFTAKAFEPLRGQPPLPIGA